MEVYSGQVNCQGFYKSRKRLGQSCNGKARYFQNGSYYCGTHSRACKTTYAVGESKKNERIELKQNPKNNQLILSPSSDMNISPKKPRLSSADLLICAGRISKVNHTGRLNFTAGRKGKLIVDKIGTIGEINYLDGFYPIFPIFGYQNKEYDYGYGCPGLSSMSLGPVNHIMTNLPPAKNIEIFFQSAKVFLSDINIYGKPSSCHFRARIESHMDFIPQRNKHSYSGLKEELSSATEILQYLGAYSIDNKKPLYSVFYSRGGIERRFTLLGSRYFYCRKYEELVRSRSELKRLKIWINRGINLHILGYGGCFLSLNPNLNQEDLSIKLFEFYINTDQPFGHEFCLAALLMIDNPRNYPWNIMYLISPETYRGIGI